MSTPFVLKLQYGAELSVEDRRALEQAAAETRQIGSHQDLIREGDRPEYVHLLIKGWACRYKVLPDGGRQIMAFLVPGDFCDLHVAVLGSMDHNIGTLVSCEIAYISQRSVEELTARHPAVNRALWWATLVDEGTLREWLVSMGRRPADEQLAHLLCELLVRLQCVGLATEHGYDFPVTQAELGDALGLSEVHVNRVLQQLRGDGLIALEHRRLTIYDVAALKEFAQFDPNYLHLHKRRAEPAGRAAQAPDSDGPRPIA